jgi:hypothetical protein
MTNKYSSTITIRVRNEIKNVFDSLIKKCGIKSNRVLEEMLLSAFFSVYPEIVEKEMIEGVKEIEKSTKQIGLEKEKLTALFGDNRAKELAEPQYGKIKEMTTRVEKLKNIHETLERIKLESYSELQVIDITKKKDRDMAVDKLCETYKRRILK